MPAFQELAIRFWHHVDKDGPTPLHKPELGPCWVWTASRLRYGYGRVNAGNQRIELAHRVSFFLEHGRWPVPCALHHCDNPPCVRPSHLFEGTLTDNTRDMIAKGRYAKTRPTATGSKNHLSKLEEVDVASIRSRYAFGGISQRKLASEYGVSQRLILSILQRTSWKHID